MLLLCVFRKYRSTRKTKYLKVLEEAYDVLVAISEVASVLAPTLSSFFITAEMGLSYTGIFAIATYIAVMVSIPYRSMAAIAAPQLATAIKENNQHETAHLMQQVSSTLLLVGGIILCVMTLRSEK